MARDYNKAITSLQADDEADVTEAIARLIVSTEKLVSNDQLQPEDAINLVNVLRQLASRPDQLMIIASGGQLNNSSAGALGAPAGSSATTQDDLQDKYDRAKARNAVLEQDRMLLERILLDNNLTVPMGSPDPLDPAYKDRLNQAVERRVQTEASTLAAGNGFIAKADVTPKIEDAQTAVNELEAALNVLDFGRHTGKLDPIKAKTKVVKDKVKEAKTAATS